ncbi:Smr/MutS family protein [Geomonas sp. Red32]|uniref:Smr/MutS family protein n=1 Tax=Geomonas sp. Red32 TaxID=2912856 RepID=UPI00202D02C0|nr:Smr/MutS family protein [Geomonas sp. Red32]MCM0080351.1 Smr/MutS family protein [Geomonas sp. Red32]
MKKKQTPQQKEKEFSVSPFKALKGVAVAGEAEPNGQAAKGGARPSAPASAAKPVKGAKGAKQKEPRPVVKSREEMEDELFFFDAMDGVRRMDQPHPAPGKPKLQPPVKTRRDEEDAKVFLQAVEALRMDVRFSDQFPDEDPSPRPAPVNRLRQLRRGAIRVDLQLDLHGLTKDEALENLDRFVRGAYNRRQKGVLVITGKGYNSDGEPVLKAAVAKWLRENGKGMVSEFVQAPNDMGGGGAVVVFLKEKKEDEPAPE